MKMTRLLFPVLLAAMNVGGLPLITAPAAAADRILIIYGNDKCPTSNGEEIVVCSRKPEGERYRIPEELRRTSDRGNENWGDRASSIEYVGRSGPQSCSTAGSGGASGCFEEMARKACDENKENGKPCGFKF